MRAYDDHVSTENHKGCFSNPRKHACGTQRRYSSCVSVIEKDIQKPHYYTPTQKDNLAASHTAQGQALEQNC